VVVVVLVLVLLVLVPLPPLPLTPHLLVFRQRARLQLGGHHQRAGLSQDALPRRGLRVAAAARPGLGGHGRGAVGRWGQEQRARGACGQRHYAHHGGALLLLLLLLVAPDDGGAAGGAAAAVLLLPAAADSLHTSRISRTCGCCRRCL